MRAARHGRPRPPSSAPVPPRPLLARPRARAAPAEGQAPQACAVIPVKKPGQPAPPTASVAGPLSLVKTAKPACTGNRVCAFEVAIENTGDTEFKGTVEFDDAITGDGAIFGATTIAPPPPAPWSCPKTGQGFKCTANLTLGPKGAANAKTTVPLTMDLGPGIGAVKEAKNCATLKDAPTPSCATVPLQPPDAGRVPLGLRRPRMDSRSTRLWRRARRARKRIARSPSPSRIRPRPPCRGR